MSNVIQFLESMGGNAVMARMSTADYEAAIAMLDTDDESQKALRLRDHSKLKMVLNGRPLMVLMVAAPQDKPEQEGEIPGEAEGEEEKKQPE